MPWKSRSGDCSAVASGVLPDTGWSQGACSQVPGGTTLSAAPRPWTLSTVTSKRMAQSALTVQPTSADRPHSAAERPSGQQRGLCAAGRTPRLHKASPGGARLPRAHSPGPSSADTGFLTKIRLCPAPPRPHHRALITAQLLIQTLPLGPDASSRGTAPVTSHRQGSLMSH